jgi:CheY-like chemotaxis protein
MEHSGSRCSGSASRTLSDLAMPELSGTEATRRIRQLEAQRALSRAARNRKEHAFRRRRGRDPFCACSSKARRRP